MVRVRERPPREVPGLVPAEARLVEEDPQELRHRERRVRVVHLDRHLLGKRAPVGVRLPEAAHQVGERAGDEEVLLEEAQTLTAHGGVVGIQHARERLRRERIGQRLGELAAAEALEVEVVRSRRRPQAQRIDRLAAVSDHGPVVGNADQAGREPRNQLQAPLAHRERAAEVHHHLLARTRDLPGILPAQPVVRLLVLPAVPDRLPEDAVLVAQPVAHGRDLQRRQRVEETGGQATEPAVAEAGVRFLLEQLDPIDLLLLRDADHVRGDPEVGDVVRERATEQELHREVVHALGVLARVGLLRVDPALREQIPHRARERLEALARAGVRDRDDVVEGEMSLVERVGSPGEPDRSASVALGHRHECVATHGGDQIPLVDRSAFHARFLGWPSLDLQLDEKRSRRGCMR